MRVIAKAGRDDIANVYIAEINGKKIEFVESIQPPIPLQKKWVLIVSTLFGCPVKCSFCDAGGYYNGKLSTEEIFSQIDYLVKTKFSTDFIDVEKFKIQFARVGEPSFNESVLEVLETFNNRYKTKEFYPSISTIAPNGTDKFFDKLLDIKKRLYDKTFQLQFSIHTTDEEYRDTIIPTKKWSFSRIAEYGKQFYTKGGRKITLNFALAKEYPFDINILKQYFDPEVFLIKITPVNPTHNAVKNNINTYFSTQSDNDKLIEALKIVGYDVILSIGELEENNIGSNCGQYITTLENNESQLENGYTYQIKRICEEIGA